MTRPRYIASCSGGKDSVATILLASEKNEPLDEVIYSEVMFDQEISGEVPEHRDFIHQKLKPFVENELGCKFTVLRSDKTYDDVFHHIITRGPYEGLIRGFVWPGKCAVNRDCKMPPLRKYHKAQPDDTRSYVGIVAIPMISEEQQKQTVLEEKSSIVNENTSGMAVVGHIGTWHTIDHKEIDGHTFWLMEHDTFGDDASCIIVDERGELVLSHIYDGFDENTVDLLRLEVVPVEKMPDDSISVEEMKQYGYKWGGMLPMREEAAAEVMKSCQIYRLYGDDTEGLVLDAKEIKDHAAKGGIFGVEKAEWTAMLERQNPLKAAEMSVEDDYGMIDGIINNGTKENEKSEKRGKSSIMDRLKAAKSNKPQDRPAPQKEKKSERDL